MDRTRDENPHAADRPAELSRRQILAAAAKAGLGGAVLAAGVATGLASGIPEALAAPDLPKKAYKFVFVNHVTTNPFFTPTIYGVQDACAMLGCSYQWTGSQNAVVSEMVSAIQTATAAKVDGIAVSIVDPTAFNKPIADALAAGIPVVAYNSDAPATSGNQRMAYVGQDLYQSGLAMGRRWLKTVPKGSHVMLAIDTPGSLNLQPRLDGNVAAIKEAGSPVTYDVLNAGPQSEQELSRIESYYLSHKTVKGLFATGGSDTLAVAKVMQKYNLPANGVHGGGYDLLPDTLTLINQGFLDFTIDQQPYLQGFYPAVQLYLYKLSGGLMFPSDTDTGLRFVTKQTVGPYLSGTSRFEGSTTTAPK
jgi:simple sugar transport system substrate-binding protein